ncbi:hypothetical protein EW145_g2455 [Phellinidium pouzarii]|uniref:Uncharacterized protein n=1 Tax=Phellinidium pouzarii TaxID=167371 RepID=A0A4S4LAS2_9AGAM|nr:hypothetical protein EW145_g2455 [Phellinidium pouzarii]
MFRSLSPTRHLDRQRSLPHLKEPSIVGKDPTNIRSATCLSIADYHSRQARLHELSYSSPILLKRKLVSNPTRSPPSSRRFSTPISFSSTSWNSDDTRTSRSRNVHTPLSGGSKSPSLQSSFNSLGDAPTSPSIRWDTSEVTSVEKAAELLQRVTTHHDVDRSVLAVRKWLNGLPWLDGANTNARNYIRAEVMDRFLRVWHPAMHVWNPQSPRKSLTFHDETEPSIISIKLLDTLHHAKILESTDIALAAEFLFKHRLRTGYMHALYELISTAGERASLYGVLNRMSALAEGLKKSKKGMTCQDVKLQAREIIHTIENFEREHAFHMKDIYAHHLLQDEAEIGVDDKQWFAIYEDGQQDALLHELTDRSAVEEGWAIHTDAYIGMLAGLGYTCEAPLNIFDSGIHEVAYLQERSIKTIALTKEKQKTILQKRTTMSQFNFFSTALTNH